MNTPQQALDAASEILRPLARLLLAHGVQHAQLAELIKAALVEAARECLTEDSQSRVVSKISVSTGIHRKEVKRLLQEPAAAHGKGRFLASEVFARWISDPDYLDADHRPRPLPRVAAAGTPSFETLARHVTRDVHPRAVLEEMKRLGLVREEGEALCLVRDSFVSADRSHTLSILADNVHDHLAATVANALAPQPPFMEQALVVDELRPESVAELHKTLAEHWQRLVQAVLPEMTRLWERDRDAADGKRHRVRLGLYEYIAPMDDTSAEPDESA